MTDEQSERVAEVKGERVAEIKADLGSVLGDVYWLCSLAEEQRREIEELKNVLRKENERLSTALGQANADLMGCRDGALVRDLRAENERLRAREGMRGKFEQWQEQADRELRGEK